MSLDREGLAEWLEPFAHVLLAAELDRIVASWEDEEHGEQEVPEGREESRHARGQQP